MSDIKAPSRAARLTLKLEADNRQGLVDALYSIADMIDREEMTTGVSGGPSSGWIYEVIVDGRPTHDEYFKEVQRYLQALKDEKESTINCAADLEEPDGQK